MRMKRPPGKFFAPLKINHIPQQGAIPTEDRNCCFNQNSGNTQLSVYACGWFVLQRKKIIYSDKFIKGAAVLPRTYSFLTDKNCHDNFFSVALAQDKSKLVFNLASLKMS